MKLLHYRSPIPNFGDDLNVDLWPALIPGLDCEARPEFDGEEAFLGIGTIIGIDPQGASRLHVFSSGAGYSRLNAWHGKDIRYHCVRGPVTAHLLGLPACAALTDGAILAPRTPGFADLTDGKQGSRIVVVPHFESMILGGWDRVAEFADFDLVDPRSPPHRVIATLAGARLVLTESLHGAILADAYGVPWRGFAISRNFSTAKWTDWTASLGLSCTITVIPPPDPLPLLRFGRRAEPFGTEVRLDIDAAIEEFRNRVDHSPAVPFAKRQAKQLLEALPLARRFLGYSPARTAEALTRLAQQEPICSPLQVRQRLADEMLDRLDALAATTLGTGALVA